MNIVSIVVIAALLFLVIAAGIFWYFRSVVAKKKYPFKYYRTSNDVQTKYAKLVIDREHKTKTFKFDFTDDTLDFRKPTRVEDGISYREITIDKAGTLAYLKPVVFRDDKDYFEMAADPEEKSLFLEKMKEIKERYANPMQKGMLLTLAGMMLLTFLVLVGVVYTTTTITKQLSNVKVIAEENSKLRQAQVDSADRLVLAAEIMDRVAITLTSGENNLTRKVS